MRFDLGTTRQGKLGAQDRSRVLLGTIMVVVSAPFLGFLVYLGLVNDLRSLSILESVFYWLLLAFPVMLIFGGFAARLVGKGADEIEVNHQGFAAYRGGHELWSRAWDDRSIRLVITVQRQPWPGWENEPPLLYINDRVYRSCNLTLAAYEAMLNEARAHELAFSSAPFRAPYYERIVIRRRAPQYGASSS